MLQLVLPEPPSANRWWRKFRNRMVLSDEARTYRDETVVAACVEQLGCAWRRAVIPAPRPVALAIDWHRRIKSGDLDKRLGVVLDALQGIAYENDSQIVKLIARRFDDKSNPRVEVTVCEVA